MSTFIKSDQSAPNLLHALPISRSGFVHPDQRVITGLTCMLHMGMTDTPFLTGQGLYCLSFSKGWQMNAIWHVMVINSDSVILYKTKVLQLCTK